MVFLAPAAQMHVSEKRTLLALSLIIGLVVSAIAPTAKKNVCVRKRWNWTQLALTQQKV